jgi:hypothetical protein
MQSDSFCWFSRPGGGVVGGHMCEGAARRRSENKSNVASSSKLFFD